MAYRITRRRFLKWALGSAATAGLSLLGGTGYAALVEPHWARLEHVDVPLPRLPAGLDGFSILQLSDLHRGTDVAEDDIARAVDAASRQGADLVAITGDYVTGSASYAASCAATLSPLAATAQVLACLGNHDHWTDPDHVAEALAAHGLSVLRNQARQVATSLWVAAVDDIWQGRDDLERTLRGIPGDAVVVLLAHEPDYADRVSADGRVDLQLSGHSHGGQVRLPWIGPLLLPHLARKYHAGLYRVRDMWLYVNRGVGLISPPVRLNCRPEITLLTLRAKEG